MAWEYAGTIGNDYSFAHAKYGANPSEKHLFRDQYVSSFVGFTFRALGVESPRGGAMRTLTSKIGTRGEDSGGS